MRNKKLLLIMAVFLIILTPNIFGALSDNLTVYYTFNTNVSSQFTSLINTTSNNGTLFGGASLQSGLINNSLFCNGTGYANLTDTNNVFDFNGKNFTINFWAKLGNMNTGFFGYGVVSRSGTDTNSPYLIGYGWNGTVTGKLYANNAGGWDIAAGVNIIPAFSNNTWVMITLTRLTNGSYRFYTNSTFYNAHYDTTDFADYTSPASLCKGQGTLWRGNIDEFGIWNRVLSDAEISQLYNSGLGLEYPFTLPAVNNITFYNQTPANVTSSTLFSENVIVQYNVSNATGMNNSVLQYRVSHNENCYQYLNGSCQLYNNTYYNNSVSGTTISIYNWTLGENVLYHSNGYLNYLLFNQSHSTVIATGQNQYYKIQYINFSLNDNLNYFEIMATSNGIANIYYCNSSYSTGNPATSNFCSQIYSGVLSFNHSHNQYSNHTLIVFSQNSTGFVGNVKASNVSYFILKQNVGVTTTIYTIPNLTGRANTYEYTNNDAVSYTDNSATYSFDTHIHQFSLNDDFIYRGCINRSGTFECSSETTERIEESIFYPVGVQILIPNSSTYQEFINITYVISQHPNAPVVNNSKIRIDLLNDNLTFNQTIVLNNGLNTSYYWNTYLSNLSVNTNYYLNITINDTNNVKTSVLSLPFNFSTNAKLNISFYNNQSGARVQNFSVNLTNVNTGVMEYYNTTNYTIYADIIKNNNYSLFVVATGYAYGYINSSPTNVYNKINTSLYGYNSLIINIFDEATGSKILQNVTITLTSATIQYTNITATGVLYLENIIADNYSVGLTTADYSVRSYTITVGNWSTQILNAYLSQTNQTVLFTITDYNTGVFLESVSMSIYGYVNGSIALLESKSTDISGKVQFTFRPSVSYSFLASKTGYEDLSFTLNPILFTSYNIKLTPLTTIPDYYNDVNIYYYPKSYNYNENKNFSFSIQSVNGLLTGYNYTFNSSCGNFAFSGNNAIGGKDVHAYTSNCSGTVTITYGYTISNGDTYAFVDTYTITSAPAFNNTFISNRGNTFGLGDFERILIVTIVTLVIVGVASIIGGGLIGLVMGLLIMGYFMVTGFISFWFMAVFIVLGVIVIYSRSREG